MRKSVKWAAIITVVLLVLIQLIPVNHTNPPVTREVKWDSPQTQALAERACGDCHSNKTVWPWVASIAPFSWLVANHVDEGRSRLNFSEWDKPNRGEVDGMARTIQRGSMPTWDYVMMHPEANLTQAEKDALIAGLTKTMQQDPPIPGQEGGER
jgi:cytochrome c551/c552